MIKFIEKEGFPFNLSKNLTIYIFMVYNLLLQQKIIQLRRLELKKIQSLQRFLILRNEKYIK